MLRFHRAIEKRRRASMKKASVITIQIGVLYAISLIGNLISKGLHLPIPGSIIGFLLLFFALIFKLFPEKWVDEGAKFMLAFLPLFFIPSTVGVIEHPQLLTIHGLLLIVIVMISTFLTMYVVGIISEKMTKVEEE